MFAHTGRGVKCGEHKGLVCSLLNAPLLRILKGESEPFNVPERASWCTVGQLKVYRALNLREYIQVLGFARVGATFKFSSMRIKKNIFPKEDIEPLQLLVRVLRLTVQTLE